MSDFLNADDDRSLKKVFSRIGLGYFVFLVIYVGGSILIDVILDKNGIKEVNSWANYFLSMLPLWFIGFPVCLLILKKLPKSTPEQHDVKPFTLAKTYLALTSVMILGNIIGTVISYVIGHLAGGKLSNTTMDMIAKQQVLPTIVFAVIFGPIMEELAFRKVLLDVAGKYSKKYAIILSGVMFGLFHLNLFQFFYAAALGMAFAYIYLESGKVRYTICLHCLVNFMHGVIPVIILKHLDLDSIQSVSLGSDYTDPEVQRKVLALYSNPAFLFLGLYGMMIFAFIILGIIIFFTHYKKINLDNTGALIQKENAIPVIYKNVGMILFLLGTIGVGIYEIMLQLK